MKGIRIQRLEEEECAIEGCWNDDKLLNIKIQKITRYTKDGETLVYKKGIFFSNDGIRELLQLIKASGWLEKS